MKNCAVPTTYKLTTLRDVYEQVPADRIELCMQEIARGMVQARALAELISAAADAISPGAQAATAWPVACEWIDDGAGDITISVREQGDDEPSLTMRITKNTGA